MAGHTPAKGALVKVDGETGVITGPQSPHAWAPLIMALSTRPLLAGFFMGHLAINAA